MGSCDAEVMREYESKQLYVINSLEQISCFLTKSRGTGEALLNTRCRDVHRNRIPISYPRTKQSTKTSKVSLGHTTFVFTTAILKTLSYLLINELHGARSDGHPRMFLKTVELTK